MSFFEKLQAKESAKPGSVSKLFSTHPPTGDRIEMDKKNIELILPNKEQYVVTTSEFNRVKAQLAQIENRRPNQEEANKPSLRRKTQTQRRDPNDRSTTSTGSSDDDSDRPTLKRDPNNQKSQTSTQGDTQQSDSQSQSPSAKSSDSTTKPDDQEPSDSDRPKLKRRDQ